MHAHIHYKNGENRNPLELFRPYIVAIPTLSDFIGNNYLQNREPFSHRNSVLIVQKSDFKVESERACYYFYGLPVSMYPKLYGGFKKKEDADEMK